MADARDRGRVPNKEQARNVLEAKKFYELSKFGQEAFFRYLCNGQYPEDKDISEISAEAPGMNPHSRRYQFWLQCASAERFSSYFNTYVMGGRNGELQVEEVDICFKKSGYDSEKFQQYLDDKKKDLEKTHDFLQKLRGEMEIELNKRYDDFYKELYEYFTKK